MNESNNKSEVLRGWGWGIILQICGLAFVTLIASLSNYKVWALFPGITQITYVLPSLIVLKSKGYSTSFLKGMSLLAIVVFLLNAACLGFSVFSYRLIS